MEPSTYEYPTPRWLWWEFRLSQRTADERAVRPLKNWRGRAVGENIREAVRQLGRAASGWSNPASIDVDPATRAALKSLRDEVDPSIELERVLWEISAVPGSVARLCPFEVCADSRRRPPHRRTDRRFAGPPDDEE
jgi:hypothetical protein